MATIIEMPKLSDTMSVGTLVKWHKVVGDAVANGDTLAEIETDKATMAMEAFDEGILSEILIEEGNVDAYVDAMEAFATRSGASDFSSPQ